MPRGLSQKAHRKVLEAATELFADRGIDATSVDAIAATSRVSKATIYKHWADKDALALEVLQYVHDLDAGPPDIDSGDLKSDVKAFLLHEPSPKKAAIIKRLTLHLIAYSARNEEFGRAWRIRVMDRARTALRKLLRRGVDRGIFPAALDEELGVALLLGPMFYSRMFGQSVNRDWLASGAVDSFWKAHARPQFQQTSPKSRSERKKDVRSGAKAKTRK
jgi:AcrR family transcriptional regulator